MPDFPPAILREYALLADGERGALVGPRGDFAWMCAPRWHDDAVFSSLIGGGGSYAVTPRDERFVWGGYYEQGSLIWRTRWVTTSTIIESHDALALPADPHRAVVLRRIRPVAGTAAVRAFLDPRAGFGAHRMNVESTREDMWEGRSGPLYFRWTGTTAGAAHTRDGLSVSLDVAPGTHHDLVLELSDRPLPPQPVDPDMAWEATERAWRDAVPPMHESIAGDAARHSYAVLHGLTSANGGMVAAATMSLPERAEQGRNYDYRYSWIRDQCFAGQGVAADGAHPLLDKAVGFVAARLLDEGPQLKPAYTVDGGRVPDERSLDLAGYPGGADKVGNWVNQQFQLDAMGEALLLFAAAERHDHLDADARKAAAVAINAIEQRWQDPDAGIWEVDDRHWTHSRLICAAGLRRFAEATGGRGGEWVRLADAIVADANEDCLHRSGRWQRSPDDERVDAALLLPAIRGAVPASDPRSTATLRAVQDDLEQDGYLYRFRQDDRPLSESEGAFLVCGFHMALAKQQQGEYVEAARWFERNRSACGPPGLLTEEFDVVQRQLRGNLPQAFVHALLIESANRLTRP